MYEMGNSIVSVAITFQPFVRFASFYFWLFFKFSIFNIFKPICHPCFSLLLCFWLFRFSFGFWCFSLSRMLTHSMTTVSMATVTLAMVTMVMVTMRLHCRLQLHSQEVEGIHRRRLLPWQPQDLVILLCLLLLW